MFIPSFTIVNIGAYKAMQPYYYKKFCIVYKSIFTIFKSILKTFFSKVKVNLPEEDIFVFQPPLLHSVILKDQYKCLCDAKSCFQEVQRLPW